MESKKIQSNTEVTCQENSMWGSYMHKRMKDNGQLKSLSVRTMLYGEVKVSWKC